MRNWKRRYWKTRNYRMRRGKTWVTTIYLRKRNMFEPWRLISPTPYQEDLRGKRGQGFHIWLGVEMGRHNICELVSQKVSRSRFVARIDPRKYALDILLYFEKVALDSPGLPLGLKAVKNAACCLSTLKTLIMFNLAYSSSSSVFSSFFFPGFSVSKVWGEQTQFQIEILGSSSISDSCRAACSRDLKI